MTKRSILPPGWDIPQEMKDRLGDKVGRQRAMLCEGHLLLILHRPPTPDEDERKGRYFWRKPDGTWSSSELGSGPPSLTRHLDEFAAPLDKLEDEDKAAVSAEDYFAVLNALAPIHRTARNLHQALQQAREKCPQDRDLLARDRAYEIERMADLLHSDVRDSLQFAIAKRTEEQAESSQQMAVSAHRLNILAAFFFPVATLSAIFGMNLKHGFEEMPAPTAFLALVGRGLVIGFALKAFVTRASVGAVFARSRSEK